MFPAGPHDRHRRYDRSLRQAVITLLRCSLMSNPTVDSPQPISRVSIWPHATTALLIFGFITAGWLRLNDCDLFNPDSPRYLIYAQSLADSGEYRAIDTPGSPLYTWRPPGLPILLAPVLRFLPYDVVAAKCVVLCSGALLLMAVHGIVCSTGRRWAGPLMVAVIGTSPMFLSLATEVLTEVPYALGILAVLYWLGRWSEPNAKHPGIALVGLSISLAFTPIIRTIGVALVAAVGLWGVTARRRWRLLPAVAMAAACLGWLSWRSRHGAGNNYAGSLFQSIREQGLPHVFTEAIRTVSFYLTAFPGVLLPGLTTEQPFYAPMVIGPLPVISGVGVLAVVATVTILALGFSGCWRERHRQGYVGLLYISLYLACLAIWPWRHERFLWPLVPVIWAFVPAGCESLKNLLPTRFWRISRAGLITGLMVFCGWQCGGEIPLIATNQRFLADRDAFTRDEAPGFYFSDWRKAGSWIRENTPQHSRLLAWQAAVGGTAHRFQRRVQFESLTPEKVRQQIASFPARYLVITKAQFGLGFNWQQVFADPAFTLSPVYDDRDVTVLEVSPNRSGRISRTGYEDWLESQQDGLDAVLARHPGRTDLLARKADLLHEQGRNPQAIQLNEELVRRGMVTVRVCSALGWLHFAEKNYEKAAYYLSLASGLPNAEPVAASLADGARRARERLAQSDQGSLDEQHERAARRIQSLIETLNLGPAERELQIHLAAAPDHADLNYWRGYLHHLYGETEQAEACYIRALPGNEQARGKLVLLQTERAMGLSAASDISFDETTETIDPTTFASHVRLAKLYEEHGWSGRALAVLEAAHQRFGDRPEILAPLAELYLRFARPEDAAPLFRLAQEAWPHDKSLRQGRAAAEAALRVPRF